MKRLLDTINSPADVKAIPPDRLPELAAEVREDLIEVVTRTGGHLASNLGAVELTIALHRVFDSPRDKLVFDVGHQAYVHKLFTGRREQFPTLRQFGGLSGYTTREESEHDPFGAAHAGTSVSAALGMAVARDLQGEDYHVVAVIGDGGLTCGMALEALNHAGHLGTALIVILNDNEMSISPNVGALSKLFDKVRLDPRYHRVRHEAESVIQHLPLGGKAIKVGKVFRDGMKSFLLPTLMWEELGFTYIGPVDGHDINDLTSALQRAKQYHGRPTFIHVVTTKGKGYHPAEQDKVKFHGISPNGASKATAPSYNTVFADAVLDLMRKDERLVAISAAMLEGTGLVKVAKEIPSRVIDVGICEQHAVTFAGGLVTQGLVPIVAIYSTFLQRGYDQVVHDICLQNLPVIFAMDRAGIVGDDGKTHQGAFDIAYFRCLPNAVVMAPKDENELRNMVYTAYQYAGVRQEGPIALRYPRGAGVGVPFDAEPRELPIGRAEILREGRDAAIFAYGPLVYEALNAAEELARRGIDCAVVNARFAKPLDAETLGRLAADARLVATVEEHALMGGFGSAVLELLAEADIRVPVIRFGLPDAFIEHGTQAQIRAKYGLTAEAIVERISSALTDPLGAEELVGAKGR